MKVILMLLFTIAFAQANEAFDRANAAYRDGRFREAVECYETLLETDGARVAVLQNLGSAYHRLGEDGRAILAFERALLLRPRDPDLQANLKLVRDESAVFPTRPSSRWERMVGWISFRAWSLIALVGAALVPVAALGWVVRKGSKGRWIAMPLGVSGVLLVAVSVLALRKWEEITTRGIVVSGPATLRMSPFEAAAEKGSLPAGREVRLGRSRDEWVWVEVEGTEIQGWMAKGEVEALVPPGS